MTVSTIATIAAGLSRATTSQNTKASALFNGLVNPANTPAKQDFTNLSAAITLQNQVAQFRVASQNVAQASSLLAAAEAGAGEIVGDLARLKDLAARAASPSLSEQERAQLSSEFATIRNRIDRTAKSARFNNEALLDGSSAQLRVASENKDIKDLSIASLRDNALFKGRNPDLATPANAKVAESIVKEAQAYANTQLDNIRALQAGLGLAASTLESAIQNQDAARSALNDADFLAQQLSGSDPLQGNDINSVFAQTNRLPSNLLQLLSE